MKRSYHNPTHWPALPTGTKINPLKPQEAEYHDPEQVHYIFLNEKGKYRDWTSFGELTGPNDKDLLAVGDVIHFFHDQTDKDLGACTLIGIRLPDGNVKGQVPGAKMPHWVAK